jgi:hypothetical protein
LLRPIDVPHRRQLPLLKRISDPYGCACHIRDGVFEAAGDAIGEVPERIYRVRADRRSAPVDRKFIADCLNGLEDAYDEMRVTFGLAAQKTQTRRECLRRGRGCPSACNRRIWGRPQGEHRD